MNQRLGAFAPAALLRIVAGGSHYIIDTTIMPFIAKSSVNGSILQADGYINPGSPGVSVIMISMDRHIHISAPEGNHYEPERQENIRSVWSTNCDRIAPGLCPLRSSFVASHEDAQRLGETPFLSIFPNLYCGKLEPNG